MKRQDLLALAAYAVLALAWFSPILVTGKLLAPGDGLVEAVPNYLSHRTLWEPLLATGHPAAADPVTLTWYPIAFLLSWIPGSYNVFVMSAYVLAAWFTCLLAFTLTGSRLGGWIAGLIYGFSGFFMAHAGHPSMIHAAAWIPAILLALERIRGKGSSRWFLFGACSVTCLVLAGHPQIILYGLCLAAAFTLLDIRLRYLVRALLMTACGIGMAAMLLVPLFELSRLTIRDHVTFDVFNTYRLPARNLVLLLFPYLFGGEEGSIFSERWSVDTERDVFLGLVTLLLVCVALFRRKRPQAVTFFSVAGVLALLLSLGGDTPLGRLIYELPLFNQFRGQSRFLVIFQLALALIAAYGVVSLGDWKRVARIGAALLLFEEAVALIVCLWWAPSLTRLAATLGFPDVFFGLSMPALLVPIGVSLVGVVAIVVASRRQRPILVTFAVLLDLASFGQFATWRYYSPTHREIEPPPTASMVRTPGDRFVTARGFLGDRAELPPLRSRIWNLTSIGNYGQLAIERYHSLLEMDAGGTMIGEWWGPNNRALDLAGARYVITDAGNPANIGRFERMPVPVDKIEEDLGRPDIGGAQRQSVSLHIAGGKAFTHLVLVSFLREAIAVPHDTPAMKIHLKTKGGDDAVLSVRAGRETAELLVDCPSITPLMKHKAATVYSTTEIVRQGQPCPAHLYFASWPLAADRHFDDVDLEWLLPTGGIQIAKLILWNRQTGDIRVASGADFYPDRFQETGTSRGARVYRNTRAMPRAWIVSHVVPMTGPDAKRAVQTSVLPDGTPFDPREMAVAEDFLGVWVGSPDPDATVTFVRDEHTSIEIRAHTARHGFLVLSDLDYPGWRATVNDTPVPIIRTNYVQRGVVIPVGDSTVKFVYRPVSLYVGLGIAAGSLVAAILLRAL